MQNEKIDVIETVRILAEGSDNTRKFLGTIEKILAMDGIQKYEASIDCCSSYMHITGKCKPFDLDTESVKDLDDNTNYLFIIAIYAKRSDTIIEYDSDIRVVQQNLLCKEERPVNVLREHYLDLSPMVRCYVDDCKAYLDTSFNDKIALCETYEPVPGKILDRELKVFMI